MDVVTLEYYFETPGMLPMHFARHLEETSGGLEMEGT